MSAPGELALWLRPKIEADLKRWRDLEAAYLPGRPREGDVLWSVAREHAEQAEQAQARLAVLIVHEHVASRTGHYGTPFDFGCQVCHETDDGQGCSDVMADGWCETVLLLAYAYRFRPGYREAEWKPLLTPAEWITEAEGRE